MAFDGAGFMWELVICISTLSGDSRRRDRLLNRDLVSLSVLRISRAACVFADSAPSFHIV